MDTGTFNLSIVHSHLYTERDKKRIKERAYEIMYKIKERSTKEWLQHVDIDYVLEGILNDDVMSVLSNGYLIVYTVTNPWYSNNVNVLSELGVFKIDDVPGNSFKDVIDTLEHLARLYECAAVYTGTAFSHSDRALSRMYQQYGYKEQERGLSKHI